MQRDSFWGIISVLSLECGNLGPLIFYMLYFMRQFSEILCDLLFLLGWGAGDKGLDHTLYIHKYITIGLGGKRRKKKNNFFFGKKMISLNLSCLTSSSLVEV